VCPVAKPTTQSQVKRARNVHCNIHVHMLIVNNLQLSYHHSTTSFYSRIITQQKQNMLVKYFHHIAGDILNFTLTILSGSSLTLFAPNSNNCTLCVKQHQCTTTIHLTALYPGPSGCGGTRKKP